MVELNPVNVRVCKKIFKMIDPKATPNIVKHDFLTFKGFKGVDKFDVVMGNPPFQTEQNIKRKGGYGGKTLWDKFVIDSFKVLKENGFLSFIHPPDWRRGKAAPDRDQEFWNNMINKQFIYLNINNAKDSKQYFNVNKRFDMYVLQNKTCNDSTIIIDELKERNNINLCRLPFIPNFNFKKINELLVNEKDGIPIIYSRSLYGNDKEWMSDKKIKDFKYPVIRTINKKGPVIWYSNKIQTDKQGNKLHFKQPKVICSIGSETYPINDHEGNYGMAEVCFGIPIKSKKEGDLIMRALNSERFINEIINATVWSTYQTEWRMFKYFKPDFYKYFLDKDNSKPKSVPRLDLEPEPEPEVEQPLVKTKSKPKKTIKKSKCSEAHPEPPCPKDKPRIRNGCCYKDNKKTKKKSMGGGRRRHKRSRRKSRVVVNNTIHILYHVFQHSN